MVRTAQKIPALEAAASKTGVGRFMDMVRGILGCFAGTLTTHRDSSISSIETAKLTLRHNYTTNG
jgi:uncharacterized membrane protein YeaQ/YmgE (transglycosylase-associated protein family)